MTDDKLHHSFLTSNFKVFLPEVDELRLPQDQFDAYVKSLVAPVAPTTLPVRTKPASANSARRPLESPKKDVLSRKASAPAQLDGLATSRFVDGLLTDKAAVPSFDEHDGKMLTENGDVTFRTSGAALVDLFYELMDGISAARLTRKLDAAWDADNGATLKIIWNARSIHLGKGSRHTFYRAIGWLAQKHPLTLIVNLPYLVRPIIPKKVPKTDEEDDMTCDSKTEDLDHDYEILDNSELDGQPPAKKVKLGDSLSGFDVTYGLAHGYWKDLLNILALAANGELKPRGNPRAVLNVEKPAKPYNRDWTKGRKKGTQDSRHERARDLFEHDKFYRALHLSVARLFADQLKLDKARLASGDKAEMRLITLTAKWAPSQKGMHDSHTMIVTTIAELLFPFDEVCPAVEPADRELYLKHARIAYQSKILSPLRKHIEIVERPITANNFSEIKYDRVPSCAMQQYTALFVKKDPEGFDKYIENVAAGTASISGVTLLPSTLVRSVSEATIFPELNSQRITKEGVVKAKVANGQWNTLVQRTKDSGTLQSSIAVCDVSGSMRSPVFHDGTAPIDSSIGLSLLLAEITAPPFGGAFITFSATPQIMKAGGVDDKRTFDEKVKYIMSSNFSFNTDFEAVFTRLILPMAVEHKLKPEEMVKKVFVFSDMQFDAAAARTDYEGGYVMDWRTSYERIQKAYSHAGYPVPELVFWNLAGKFKSFYTAEDEDAAAKPVQADTEGTELVSGYSHGQLKMFLDNGHFADAEEEVVEEEVVGKDGDGEVLVRKKKKDPMDGVKRAISHDAYRMLRVVD